MSIRDCHFNCRTDRETGEILCPWVGWVRECPKNENQNENENQEKENEDEK